MTIGIRDTRKIDAVYNLTEQDVRGEARFGDCPVLLGGAAGLLLAASWL